MAQFVSLLKYYSLISEVSDQRNSNKESTPAISLEAQVLQLLEDIRQGRFLAPISRELYPQTYLELRNSLILEGKPTGAELEPATSDYPEMRFYSSTGSSKTKAKDTSARLPNNVKIDGHDYNFYIQSLENSYTESDRLTDYYQERVRQQAYNKGRESYSIQKLWQTPELVTPVLEEAVNQYWQGHPNHPRIKSSDVKLKSLVMDILYQKRLHVSQYRISWVLWIITIFGAFYSQKAPLQTVLDPFAGWGDRLIGAITLGKSYYGFDPNTDLQPGYHQIIKDLAREDQFAQVIPMAFEDVPIKTDRSSQAYAGAHLGMYDFMLTSPPYFNIETYSEAKNQSIARYPDFEDWLKEFYRPALRKALAHIKPGGFGIIQINDRKDVKLVQHTIDVMQGYGYCGQFATLTPHKFVNIHLVARIPEPLSD